MEGQFYSLHKAQFDVLQLPLEVQQQLEHKLTHDIFDISEAFDIIESEDNERCLRASREILPSEVFIIDHALSFADSDVAYFRDLLRQSEPLLDRLMAMMEFEPNMECTTDELIEKVFERFWRYAGSYFVANEGWKWYMMDEFGSAVQHSEAPNCIVVPFVHITNVPDVQLTSYSILYATSVIQPDADLSRDFVYYCTSPKDRHSRLVAWQRTASDTDDSLTSILISEAIEFDSQLHLITSALPPIPPPASPLPACKAPLRVYIDASDPCRLLHPSGGLTHSAFQITDNRSAADILWLSDPITDSSLYQLGSSPSTKPFINQFPYEGALVLKDHLSREIAKHIGAPDWFLPSYDLQILFPTFTGEYLRREASNKPNVWIIKPAVSAHSAGHVITPYLSQIPALLTTNPARVAMEYITKPLLLRQRRFDMRFVTLLRSAQPAEMYVYDVFWTRLAHHPADQHNNYTNKQSSFTAMHLINESVLDSSYPDYLSVITELEETYNIEWKVDILPKIHALLKEAFFHITSKHPMKCSNSRAIYGCDIMMDEVQPKLLEVTFMPANNAVMPCFEKTYESYVNDVFGCLFLGETNNVTRLL